MTEAQHMEPASFAVATDGLSVRYGKTVALESVDLRVPDGAVYVLVGENGAGKSSMMKALLNLEPPVQGRAEVFGLDSVSQGPRVRAQIGYVADVLEYGYRWMTGAQLIKHVSAFHPKWDRAYADELCAVLGVLRDRKIGTLSKGEMRRLQFVLALAHRPPLLLLDEPTDGLDPVVRHRTLAKLAQHLADSPTTVVISTHHVQEVDSLVDHFGVLRAGQLIAQMSRDDLHKTVRRYRVEVTEKWQQSSLHVLSVRRSSLGREVQATVVGEEKEVVRQLAQSGSIVRDVKPLSLEEAALAFLGAEVAP